MWPQKWKASAFCARSAAARSPPPLTPSSSRPARARNPRREVDSATASLSTHRLGRGGEHALELEERVERALGEHLAVGREHDRVRAAGNRERRARPRRPRPRRRPRARPRGRRRRSRSDGSSARQSAQPGEREDGERERRVASRSARSARRRPPSSGPSCSSESAACGAIASRSSPTSRASARRATASAARPTSATTSPVASQASVGGLRVREERQHREAGCEQPAVRRTALQPIRERAPKQPHGLPARPREIATDEREREDREHDRGRFGGARNADGDGHRRRGLERDDPGPGRRLGRRARDPVRAQSGARPAAPRGAWQRRSRAAPRPGRNEEDPRSSEVGEDSRRR